MFSDKEVQERTCVKCGYMDCSCESDVKKEVEIKKFTKLFEDDDIDEE